MVPPTVDHPFGGSEAKDVALARVRSSRGPGAQHAFLEQLRQTELERFPRTSMSMLRGEPWESKSSWRQVAPDAIEVEMGAQSPLSMQRPVREMARR